jgi:hypothetical protein
MGNFQNLKNEISRAIRENGNQEITGDLLQEKLLEMVDSLGKDYKFRGVATPDGEPITDDTNVFYVANTVGTYPNYGGLAVADGEIAFFTYNGSWSKVALGDVASKSEVKAKFTELSSQVIFDVSEYNKVDNKPKTYTDLSEALTDVPVSKCHGGMSIRYIQSFDNKYVQWQLMSNVWTNVVDYWMQLSYSGSRYLLTTIAFLEGRNLTSFAKNGYYSQQADTGIFIAQANTRAIIFTSNKGKYQLVLKNITAFSPNNYILSIRDIDTNIVTRNISINNLVSDGNNDYHYDLEVENPCNIVVMYSEGNSDDLQIYFINNELAKINENTARINIAEQNITDLQNINNELVEGIAERNWDLSDFTESGYWITSGQLQTGYNYSSTPLQAISAGSIIHFRNFKCENSSYLSAQIMRLFDNEQENIARVVTSELSLDENGNSDYEVPSGVGYIGFSWSVDYQLPSDFYFYTDIELNPKQKLIGWIETYSQTTEISSPIETTDYYIKGNIVKPTYTKKLCILAGGQSNINGAIPISEMPASITTPGNKCHYCRRSTYDNAGTFVDLTNDALTSGKWGVDLPLYNELCNNENREIYVIKTSYGGVGIDPEGSTGTLCWTADYEQIPSNDSLLLTFENQIRTLVSSYGSDFDIRAFIWHQGEGDAKQPVSDRYYNNLKKVIAYIRGVVGNPTLPFLFGTISHNSAQYSAIVEQAMFAIANEDVNIYLVDMSNAVLRDAYHFNAAWATYLGQKWHDCLIDAKVITGTKINPSEPE